jgi:hypothetical protein
MASQTVYYTNPSFINSLQTTVSSLSGAVSGLKWNVVSSASWTAQSNTNYVWNLPDVRNTTGAAIVTLPASPADGDAIEIVDGLGTWGNCLYTNVGLNMNGKALVGMTATGTRTDTTCQGGFRDYRKGSILLSYRAANNTWYANGTVGRSMTSEYGEVANEVEDPWMGWWMFYTPFTISSMINGKANGGTFPTLNGGPRSVNFSHVYFDTSTYPITTIFYTSLPSDPSAGGAYSTRAMEYLSTGATIDKTQLVNAFSQIGSLPSAPWQASAGTTNQGGGFRLQSTAGIASFASGQLVPDFQSLTQTNWGVLIKLKAQPGYTQKAQVEASIDEFFNQSDIADGKNYNDQTENFKMMCLKAIYETNPQSQQIGGLAGAAGRFVYEKDPYFIGNTGPNGFNAGGIQAIEVMNEFLSTSGKTFTTPITQIIKSYTGPSTLNGYTNVVCTGSTEVTTIFTRGASYCTPGANVTVSGLTGSWSVMNGYYPNGVSLWENITRNSMDSQQMDCVLTDTSYTGSLTNSYNRFNLIYDSWSGAYEAQTTGAYLNYAINYTTGSQAQVSVTHRVYPTMGYNELFAAYMAFLNYVFGPMAHSRSTLQYLDTYKWPVIGRMATNWHLLGTSAYQATPSGQQDMCNTRPQEINCVTTLLYERRGPFNKISWYMRNDPYNVNNSIWNAYFSNPSGIGTLSSYSPFAIQNYLATGTAKILYSGLDGPVYKNVIYNTGYYQSAGATLGLRNISAYPSVMTGGSTYVGRMFNAEYVPTGTGGPFDEYPDPRYWKRYIDATSSDWVNNYVRARYTNFAGLIRPEYTNFAGYTGWVGATGTRRIGYIQYGLTQIDDRFLITSAFAPPVDPSNPTGPYNPRLATDPGAPYSAALRNVWAAMFNYLFGPTGAGGLACDSVILDDRNNQGGGGSEGEELASFFGGDRNGIKTFSRKADDGFSPLIDPDTLTFPLGAQSLINVHSQTVKVSENKINYPNVVFSGTGTSNLDAKKVVLLYADGCKSNGNRFVRFFSGDNFDGKIGSNTIVKIIGSSDSKYQGSNTTSGYSEETSDQGNLYMNGLNTTMQWNTETPSYNLSCQYIPVGKTGTLWMHKDSQTFAPAVAKNGFVGTCGTGASLPADLQSYLYPGMGAYPGAFAAQQAQFPNLYLQGKTEVPDITNPLTWRDPWLETAIYEAMVPVLPGEN